jgi:hypothetical protein
MIIISLVGAIHTLNVQHAEHFQPPGYYKVRADL